MAATGTKLRLCSDYALNMQGLCSDYEVTMQWLCSDYAVAM